MGYVLWVNEELAWAAGTYEYRPQGAAVISATQLFRERDFSRRTRMPLAGAGEYAGHFASIGHMNGWLLCRRAVSRPRDGRNRRRRKTSPRPRLS